MKLILNFFKFGEGKVKVKCQSQKSSFRLQNYQYVESQVQRNKSIT